ncbi:MAG: PRC-barrel domain-containing protein [Candidatus Magasanikbacteria bacterium]|nr:PRC-barrel domain-containing protein [Candidatus Magasanikbacteria bacterium]
MRVSLAQLKRLQVRTQSGIYLGKVRDFVVDSSDHSIVQYIVRSRRLASREYLIHRNQVLSISETQITVEDSLAASRQVTEEKSPNRAEPVSITEVE